MVRAVTLLSLVATSGALVAPGPSAPVSARHRVVVSENFGFNFAEDQTANTPLEILGERRLKTEYVRSYKPTASVLEGKPYPVFQELQEKKVLSATVEAGLLGSLEDLGLTLTDLENLLPLLDKAGVLRLASKNLPLAIIATGYLLIEPAPFLLPAVGALLAVNSGVWTSVAAVTTVAEAGLVATNGDGLVELLLAPALLVSGVLALVPLAIGGVKNLPPAASA